MIITSRRRIRNYSAPIFVPGNYPRATYSLPLGVESLGFTGKYTGTIFKYGPMAALAALDNYYIDDAWFTGPTYNVNSQADWNALNKSTVAEWSTILVAAGITLTRISLPRRTGWDPTTGGGLVQIKSSGLGSLPAQSNGVPGAARRVNSSHIPFMFNVITELAGIPPLFINTALAGGWVFRGANMYATFGTSVTATTWPIIAINNSAYDTDPTQMNQYILFSQCLIHNDETGPGDMIRGVEYGTGKYCAFIDSELYGFVYDGGDSQALWVNAKAPGYLGFFNTRMKALSQGFIIGGNDPPPIYRASHRPKHVDCRYGLFDPNSSGKWTTAPYAGESKGLYELKCGENVLFAFNRGTVRMYSGSYEACFLIKAGDQSGNNPAYAARVDHHTVWCNVVDNTNAGGFGMGDIFPASSLAEGCHNVEVLGNLFKPGTLQGQPGAPPDKSGYRYLFGYAYSNGTGGQNIRFAHNTGEAKHRMFEFVGPPVPANKTLAGMYIGENVNLHQSLNYGPLLIGFQGGIYTNATFAQAEEWANYQLTMRNNISVDVNASKAWSADMLARGMVAASRANVIEDYAGGNYRVKAAYQGVTSDGLPPGAFVDLIEAETANLL